MSEWVVVSRRGAYPAELRAKNAPAAAIARAAGAPEKSRRRPTLPGGSPPSTIGAGGLHFRVRNGNGCFPAAIVTGNPGATWARMKLSKPSYESSRASTSVGTQREERTQALGRLVPVG